MAFIDIIKGAAADIGILSSSGTVLDGRVTLQSLKDKINDIYINTVGQLLIDKYPEDFLKITAPFNTYRVSFSVVSINPTTLELIGSGITDLEGNSSVFANLDEGYTIYNSDLDETVKITGYVNTTTIVVESEPDSDWTGDTCYILGNLYPFWGDMVNAKEVVRIQTKYNSSQQDYRDAGRTELLSLKNVYQDDFSTNDPAWFQATIEDQGVTRRGFGILPFPINPEGKLIVHYTAKPEPMQLDTDEPQLNVMGISEVLRLGASAWGTGVLRDWASSDRYNARYLEQLAISVKSYKPKSKSGGFRQIVNPYYSAVGQNRIPIRRDREL